MDEKLDVTNYVQKLARTVDGIAWLATCALSLLAAIDMSLGLGLVPLRERADAPKAAVLIVASPILTFLVLVVLRQLPLSRGQFAAAMRAAVVLAFYLLINF